MFNVSLNWFRNRTYDPTTGIRTDTGQADLGLRVIDLATSNVISESLSLYNTSELLSFLLPRTSKYGIEVVYSGNTFGSMSDINYGLAWSGTAHIPDFGSTLVFLSLGLALMGASKFRRRNVC